MDPVDPVDDRDQVAAAKARWRGRLRRARRSLAPAARADAEARVALHLLDFAALQHARVVAVYAPTGGELALGGFITAWRAGGGVTVYPRVVGAGLLVFAQVDQPADLVSGYRGIPEPSPTAPEVPLADVDLVLVPGLGFDAAGGRLGQGGGFYDRLLAAPGRRAIAVGVGFAAQLVKALPTAPHDARVDVVVTEGGIARTAGAAR